jgi:hypothetical protein
MISVLILTLNDYGISLNLDILSIRDYRKSKMLSDLWSYLCGITIDSLTSCDNQIII